MLRNWNMLVESLDDSVFKHIIEMTADAILVLDEDGNVLMCNPAASRMFGRPFDDMVGKPLGAPLQLEYTTEIDILLPTREVRTAEMQVVEIKFDSRRAFLADLRDITERQQAERERRELIARLSQSNAELEQFTTTISHDLKSPLVTITGFLTLLKQDIEQQRFDRVATELDRVIDVARSMERLITDLLKLARLDDDSVDRVRFSLKEVADEAVLMLQGPIDRTGATVRVDERLPQVNGIRTQFVQVFENLIANALKYAADGTTPTTDVSFENVCGEPVVKVADNGIGLKTDDQERIFEMFTQLNTRIEGTGTGLAIVKKVIESHGGRVWAQSDGPGQGSSFYFTIPLD